MKENSRKTFVDLAHARSTKQRQIMKKIVKDGVCPFCREHFLKYHTKPIIKETDHWIFTENFNPYEGTKAHFLIVYKKHAVLVSEIDLMALKGLFDLLDWAIKRYKIKGGSFLIRFGDTRYTGGSVNHLHAHLIVGQAKSDDPGAESLKIKIGYKKK